MSGKYVRLSNNLKKLNTLGKLNSKALRVTSREEEEEEDENRAVVPVSLAELTTASRHNTAGGLGAASRHCFLLRG